MEDEDGAYIEDDVDDADGPAEVRRAARIPPPPPRRPNVLIAYR